MRGREGEISRGVRELYIACTMYGGKEMMYLIHV